MRCSRTNAATSKVYTLFSCCILMKDFELLKQIKAIQLEHPEKGYRKIWREIKRQGEEATEKQIRRVMNRFGLMALFPGKNLSKSCKRHQYGRTGKSVG